MKVFKNYLWNILYQLFSIIVPLVTIPYISRVLGPNGVGISSYTSSIVQYFILFGSIGINIYGNRQVAYIRDNKQKTSQIFWEILILRALVSSGALILFCVFSFLYSTYTDFLLAQSILIVAGIFDVSWLFMGFENFRVTVLRNVLVKIISIIAIFIFVKHADDTLIYILILSISTLIGNVSLLPYLKLYITKPDLKKIKIWRHLYPSISLFIPQVAIQIYVVLNKTMLGSISSTNAAGFYENSDKLVRIVLAVVTATGTVLLPHVANKFSQSGFNGIRKLVNQSFSFVNFITVPMCFGLMAVGQSLADVFFGPKFHEVGILIVIEAVAALFISWNNAIGNQFLLPTGQNKEYTVAVTIGAVVNIILNIPLIMLFSARGAMIATVFSEIAVSTSMLYSARKNIRISDLFHGFWKTIVAGLTMFSIVIALNQYLDETWTSLIIESIIGAIIYIMLVVLLKHPLIIEFKSRIKNHKTLNN